MMKPILSKKDIQDAMRALQELEAAAEHQEVLKSCDIHHPENCQRIAHLRKVLTKVLTANEGSN